MHNRDVPETQMFSLGRENLVPGRDGFFDQESEPLLSPGLSIVVPAYVEEGNLRKLYEDLIVVLKSVGMTWELIFVDDGSTDNTWQEVGDLQQRDPRVKGLRFSRNFGHQYALFAGLSHARGRAIVTMDADLQHPPSVIPQLLQEWRNGNKVVHTVRIDDENIPKLKKITSQMFYKVFSCLSGVDLSAGMADFRLLDRQVVDDILQLKEGGLFLRGLVHWVGYPSSKVEFECRDRFTGESKYNWLKMLRFAWSGITSFSIIPLRIAIFTGILTSTFAFYQLAEALYTNIVLDQTIPGWTSLFGMITLLFGILFLFLGILGEYIARILEEVRGRPRYIVSDRIGLDTINYANDEPVTSGQIGAVAPPR